ncbi:YxiJ family protein [Lysinibacillus agricola]|uniref:YxiJ family protein n=1 Tax=Lysinibacillus agricola TaxID=2590012 RepID=UPI003C17A6BC
MENIIKQLTDLKNELNKPFPYKDTDKIQEDFRSKFLNLSEEDDCLTGDFNTYCMNISGTLNYVLAGKTTKIPKSQMEFLQMSFFDFFKQYKFFEHKICDYQDFFEEYNNFEVTRKLLLKLIE